MIHKFELTFSCDHKNEFDLQLLLRDALTSFVICRIPPSEYVQKRYSYLNDKQQQEKIKQVNDRLDLVDQIRNTLVIESLAEDQV